MKTRDAAAMAFVLLASACSPAAEYTESEAPNRLTLDRTAAALDVRFLRGSDRLVPADEARLQRLAAAGAIAPSDRVTVSAAGSPELAAARRAAVSAALLRYDIVVTDGIPGRAPPDRAVIATERTLVQLPDCPNWSKYGGSDFANTVASNFGCANVTNLGRMVANPTDLASGQPLGPAAGLPASNAVDRHLLATQYPSAYPSPLLPTTSASGGGGAGGGAGGGGGGGAAAQ